MANCLDCGRRKGLFEAFENGTCKNCVEQNYRSLHRHVALAAELFRKADTAKTFNTKLKYIEESAGHLSDAVLFEQRGYAIDGPSASGMLQKCLLTRKQLVLHEAQSVFDSAEVKSKSKTTTSSRITPYSSARAKIHELKSHLDDPRLVCDIESAIDARMHRLQFDGYVEKARKEEFKGNEKKALDQYQEALFFLKNDEIDDHEQSAPIYELEIKIKELRNRLNA